MNFARSIRRDSGIVRNPDENALQKCHKCMDNVIVDSWHKEIEDSLKFSFLSIGKLSESQKPFSHFH